MMIGFGMAILYAEGSNPGGSNIKDFGDAF